MQTDLAETKKAPVPIPLEPGRGIVPVDLDSMWRLCTIVARSGLAPNGLNTPDKIFVAAQLGYELGIDSFMSSIQNIAVIGGKPTTWGSMQLAVVQNSGKLESIKEYFEGNFPDDDFRAVCELKRKGSEEPVKTEFSILDAKLEGLLSVNKKPDGTYEFKGKDNWRLRPKRMLKMRALSWALRDVFPDVLKGVLSREEMQDAIDVTPASVTATATLNKVPDHYEAAKPPTEKPVYDVQPGPTPADDKPDEAKAEPVTSGAGGNMAPEPAPDTTDDFKIEFEVGKEYDYYSPKEKANIRVMVAGINKGKTAQDTTLIIEMVGSDGKLTGKKKTITLPEMNMLAPKKGNETDHTEPEPPAPIEPAEFQRTKESGTLAIMRQLDRIAVTPDSVLNLLWAKIKKNGWPCSHEKYVAWLSKQQEAEAEKKSNFTGDALDRIGNDPDRIALKKIHAKIKEMGLDDLGVKIAMRQVEVGGLRPFDVSSRSDIKLRYVSKFMEFLEDLTPIHAIFNHIRETQQILDTQGKHIDLMARVIKEIRNFSPEKYGNLEHIYQVYDKSGVREFITKNLDAWCQPETEAGPEPKENPEPDKQRHIEPAVLPSVTVFLDALNYGCDLVGIPKDSQAKEYNDLAPVVSAFICETFEINQTEMALGLPAGVAEKMRDNFKSYYDNHVAASPTDG